MRKGLAKILKASVPSVVGVVFLLVVWAVCYALVGNGYLIASPWESLKAAFSLLGKGSLYGAFFATFFRAVTAFLISLAAALPLAALSFVYPPFGKFLAPTVACFRALPTLAVLLLLLVLLGGNGAAVAVGVSALFPMLYTAFYQSLVGVDGKLKELCVAFEVPPIKQIKGLYLPHALPKAVERGGAALSFALKITVSAEILAVTFQSVGGLMQEARLAAEMATLTALTLLVCVIGIAIESACNALARSLARRFLCE